MKRRSTYLLTWNPKRFRWAVASTIAEFETSGSTTVRWSCGRTKRIEPGDRLFWLRQGSEPRGILASGTACSRPRTGRHWNPARGGTTQFLQCRLDALVDPESDGVLRLSRLRRGALGLVHWRTQASGIALAAEAAEQLERLWATHLEAVGRAPTGVAEEVASPSLYKEGAITTIAVNRYERDARARKACIAHHGATCAACDFDFATTYGRLGKGYIHVHHIVPLHTMGSTDAVDPVTDLRPVCANCHAMLHRGGVLRSISDLRRCLRRQSATRTRA